MASMSEQKPSPSLNLNPQPKTTLVSGIVDQLIKSGYKGDLMKSAGMTYSQSDMPDVRRMPDESSDDMHEDMIVDDINFGNQSSSDQDQSDQEPINRASQKEMSKSESKKKNDNLLEERTKNSQDQIEKISKSSRVLYGQIDSFISSLREAAEQSKDNPRLGHKLENLRRFCVGFVRNMEQQMPNYATSLFVNLEEENDS
jgi:hypothetical protein